MITGFGYKHRGDAELVALVSEGAEAAFREILKRHQAAVYSFALRLLKDPGEAEDVVQETFLRLFNVAGRYRAEAALRTFLLRIARNLCIDHQRKKSPELVDELPDVATPDTPLNLLEKALETKLLEQAIAGLPVNQRAALLLRHSEQLSYQDIAEVMELSTKAVESLLVRARRNLKQALSKTS